MNELSYNVELLTDTFCAGADPNKPEIRVPSIRGHLRLWHRRIGAPLSVDKVWGGVKNSDNATASKVTIRLKMLSGNKKSEPLLPHKNQARRSAICALSKFELMLLSRNQQCLDVACKVAETWMLLGGLGARSNRAAGSVWNSADILSNIDAFGSRLEQLGIKDRWELKISKEPASADELRKAASDTLNGYRHIFGGISPRQDSPLKMKVVRLGDGHHLLLYAENRGVTSEAIRVLQNKPVGRMGWIDL